LAGALPWTLLGELYSALQTSCWFKMVLLLTERGGKGMRRKKWKGQGRKREGKAVVAPGITPTGSRGDNIP